MPNELTTDSTATPWLSVVVVTWNARKYVQECLDSLHAYKDLPTEIIVVDNASTDGTPQFILQSYPRIVLFRNSDNLGFASGNNLGIEHSRGKYLLLVNSDVNLPPHCLTALVSYMEENRDIGLLGPQMRGPSGDVRRSTMRYPTLWNSFCRAFALDRAWKSSRHFGGQMMLDFAHDRTTDVEVLNGWFWVVRREALSTVGLLDTRFFMYGEDLDWCYRFRTAGWRVVFYSDANALHYGGASSSAAPVRFYVEMHRANFQYWRKHHSRVSQFCYGSIVVAHHMLRIFGYSAVYAVRHRTRSEIAHKLRRSLALLKWLVGLSYDQIAKNAYPKAS